MEVIFTYQFWIIVFILVCFAGLLGEAIINARHKGEEYKIDRKQHQEDIKRSKQLRKEVNDG